MGLQVKNLQVAAACELQNPRLPPLTSDIQAVPYCHMQTLDVVERMRRSLSVAPEEPLITPRHCTVLRLGSHRGQVEGRMFIGTLTVHVQPACIFPEACIRCIRGFRLRLIFYIKALQQDNVLLMKRVFKWRAFP